MSETTLRTTNGAIALYNLHAHIEGMERQCAQDRLSLRACADLVDLLLLRGQITGRIVDYERAVHVAEQLAHAFPTSGLAFVARARTRACLHRFADALYDLQLAERFGLIGPEVDAERAAIVQAIGRYDEALALHDAAVKRQRTFETLAALAVLHAERGDVDDAERLFDESRAHFRGVSPFGLAQLDFQRAHLWLHEGNLTRARDWLLQAWQRVPAFAPVEGHLAEVEAELGEPEQAIARLRHLAASSDDPDYAAQLARILTEIGQVDEAAEWRVKAARRYAELIDRHREAFADHAAEFYLTFGIESQCALRLARLNVAIRPTPRALALLERAKASAAAVSSDAA